MESPYEPSPSHVKPPRPAIRISFAKHADAPTLARVLLLAFEKDRNTAALHPRRVGITTEELLSRDAPLEERRLRRNLVGNDIYVKASVRVKGDIGIEEERIVGWARWTNPAGGRRRSIWDWVYSKVIYPAHQFFFRLPVAPGLPQEIKRSIAAQHETIFGPGGAAEGRKHWYLHLLIVDPQWQGLGIGGALLNWGFERAREDDAAIYLESTAPGFPIYLSKGFRVVSARTFQVNGFQIKFPGMVWEPRTNAPSIGSEEKVEF